ncbi:MAG: HAMP domain-containing sensor histidine kinase [Planctomycetota bacterium]
MNSTRAEDAGGRRVRASLRTPIVLAVIAANVVTFGVLLFIVQGAVDRDRAALERDYDEQLSSHLGDVVDGLGRIRARPLLNWRGWRWFDDVLVAQAPVRGLDGRLRVEGAYLNPLGRAHRDVGFDEQRALELVAAAVQSDGLVRERGFGSAVPIGRRGAAPWGAAWFRGRPAQIGGSPAADVLPYFLVALLGTTLGVLFLLRRKVIDPLASLAGAVQSLEDGDTSARVAVAAGRRDELGVLGRGFNDMADRVERHSRELERAVDDATDRARSAEQAAMTRQRLAATGELAAGIAHELNNPLGGLINAVEALGREDLDPRRRTEYLELVRGGLHRMGDTVGRLLRLSPRATEPEPVQLERPLGDALGLARHRAQNEGVAVVVSGPGDHPERDAFAAGSLEPLAELPHVEGASNDLGQAFLNLLVNALDAIADARESGAAHGGASRVRIHADDRPGGAASIARVELTFEDDGPGVPDALRARVSDAFFTTKSQGKGSGLGLAIVHNVVAAHGGAVRLDGRPGKGFRVTISLPLPDVARDDAGGPAGSSPP